MTCGARYRKPTATASRRHPRDHSESRSSPAPLAARDPENGLAAGGAEMRRMRRRAAPAARARRMVRPMVERIAGGAAAYSAVQLRRGPMR